MSITQSITALPAAPDPATDTPAQFSAKAAAYVLAQNDLPTEVNTWATQANALATAVNGDATAAAASSVAADATGGSVHSADTASIADSDPGAGKLRWNHATQTLATVLYIDLVDIDTVDVTAWLDSLDDSTSATNGTLKLQSRSDRSKWVRYSVGAVTSATGYRKIAVTYIDGPGAITNNSEIALQFSRTGDKGEPGTGITDQATGFTATGGTTPKTLTVDADFTTSQAAKLNATNTYSGAQNLSRAVVASAATTADIWGASGNEIDFTGTATVTDFPDAPQAGASRILHCAAACTFTNNSNIAVPGGTNYTAATGDIVTVHALTAATFGLEITRASGTPVVQGAASMTLLSTYTVSTPVAYVDFLSSFSSTYDDYVMVVSNLSPAVAADFRCQFGAAGVADADNEYAWGLVVYVVGSAVTQSGNNATDAIRCTTSSNVHATNPASVRIEITDANSTGRKQVFVRSIYNDGTNNVTCVGGGEYYGANAMSGIRLFFGGQNTDSGVFKLYGVQKS